MLYRCRDFLWDWWPWIRKRKYLRAWKDWSDSTRAAWKLVAEQTGTIFDLRMQLLQTNRSLERAENLARRILDPSVPLTPPQGTEPCK